MNPQVKQGYKLTEAGVIPDDWNVYTVGSAFTISNQLRLPISSVLREKNSGPYPYYGPTGVQGWINEFRVNGTYALIGEDGDHFLKWATQPMTLLVSGKFNVNNHAHLIGATSNNLVEWFYWFFSSRDLTQHLTRQGASRYKLTKAALVNLPCVLPPKPEQKGIVSALSDVEALVIGLDQLISKKRDIKKATMQKLLNGQQRLPGFSGEWEKKPFFDVLSRVNGKNNQIQAASYKTYGTFPVVDQGKDYIVGYSDESDRVYFCPSDGVIVFGDHTCTIKYINFDFIVGADGVQIIRAKDGNCTRFIAYKLELSGVTSTGYNRHFKFLKELEFLMPAMEEQAAIATILADMDSELAALETRRDKARQLKQGMIQELLTGRIRLSQTSQEAKLC